MLSEYINFPDVLSVIRLSHSLYIWLLQIKMFVAKLITMLDRLMYIQVSLVLLRLELQLQFEIAVGKLKNTYRSI